MARVLDRAAAVRPSPRQLTWQLDHPFTAFVHFGVNTFTGREWGTGSEDPAIFDPSEFDAEQWVAAAQQAGMTQIMLTVKHHDGFCLWPSRFTDHDVDSSPFQRDIVGEVSAACSAAGLRFGLYLSPADLHEMLPEHRYGNGSVDAFSTVPSDASERGIESVMRVNVDDYNRYFLDQLHELLTTYAPVHEVWFDGANPKPGTGQTYAYQVWYELIRQLAPDAVISIKGPDVRWCGNEAGNTRGSEWSVIPLAEGGDPLSRSWPDMTAEDLGSREKLVAVAGNDGTGGDLIWYPAQTNTSLRHGWFWRDESQHVKPAAEIIDVWERSVGGNTVFLLNLTPDRRGLVPERDTRVLAQTGSWIRRTYGAPASPDVTRRATTRHGDDAPDGARLSHEIRFAAPIRFDRLRFREDIAASGQRIESWVVEVEDGSVSTWREVARGTTVGAGCIARFDPVFARSVRLRILGSRRTPHVADVHVHETATLPVPPQIRRNRDGRVVMTMPMENGGEVRWRTGDGPPTLGDRLYTGPIELEDAGLVSAVHIDRDGTIGPPATVTLGPSKAKWRIVHADSFQPGVGNEPIRAIDHDPGTIWHTAWSPAAPPHPHTLTIDLGEQHTLAGALYLPRQDGVNGTMRVMSCEVSVDGETWRTAADRVSLGNLGRNQIEHRIEFSMAHDARFVRFTSHQEINGQPWASAAEVSVIIAAPRENMDES